jgi:hypothetical protein
MHPRPTTQWNARANVAALFGRWPRLIRVAMLVAAVSLAAGRCRAINIVLDYSDDTFFAAHPTAKASLEAAAQEISNLIISPLNATATSNAETVNSAMVTFNYSLSIKNPTTGQPQTINAAALPANQVRIYVGMQNIETGSEEGQGGPGSVGVSANVSYFNQSDVPAAVAATALDANTNLTRGGGPIINTLSSPGFSGIPNSQFSFNFGSLAGNLWFDSDTNNDNTTDSDAVLNNFWQFDHTKPVGPGQLDFYSVALHEMLHALGFSTSASWTARDSSGSPANWTGAQVIALEGTGTNVLQPDGEHINSNLLSTTFNGDQLQQPVMSPTINIGTRKQVTDLDLAFMRDIGWQTAVLGDMNQDHHFDAKDISAMLKALINPTTYETAFNISSSEMLTVGDINGDGRLTNADLQDMIGLLKNGDGSLQAVPEPGSLLLMCCGLIGLCFAAGRMEKNRYESCRACFAASVVAAITGLADIGRLGGFRR